MQSLASSPVTTAELEQAKNYAVALANKEVNTAEGTAKAWLDVDTYQLPSPAEQMRAFSAISTGDVQRVATRLLHDSALASVVVGNSDVVKAQLERYGKVEILGEIDPMTKPESKNEAKPLTKSDTNANPQTKIPAKPE
jgi:hypothetical protein